MNPDNKGRASLISVITTPLGFFALSLLIVEGFLGITLIGSTDNTGWTKFWAMMIGASLFLIVVILVTLLVWKKPQNLTFSGQIHLEHDKTFGSPTSQFTEKQLAESPKVSDNQVKKSGVNK